MKIPFLDLKLINNEYLAECQEAMNRVLNSGWYILGKELETFEESYSAYCKAKFCVGLNSGMDALTLGLKALINLGYLKKGDEVIVPANTFIATVSAVVENDLRPILVEPCPVTHNIDVSLIKKAISPKTKCIIPVHLYGQLADMEKIIEISKELNLIVIEDAAQAHGARIKEKVAGSFGRFGAFSFYPGKNLGALGDAGAIVLNDEELYKEIKSIRNYGGNIKYQYDSRGGVNSRLDEIQAAVLSIKLKYLDQITLARINIANYFDLNIENKFIHKPKFSFKNTDQIGTHVFHLYVMRTKYRDSFIKHMHKNDIECSIHYPIPPNKQLAFQELNLQTSPLSEKLANEVISIPNHQLLSKDNLEKIVDTINLFEV